MKSFYALLVLFVLLMGNMGCSARKDVGEYWKSFMNDQPMPESIKARLHDDQKNTIGSGAKRGRFVEKFDVKKSNIIYRMTMSHHTQKSQQAGDLEIPSLHGFKMKN